MKATTPISDPFGLQRIGLEIQAQIDRRNFGMDFNQVLDNGGLFVGNKVKITIDCEMTREL